MLRNTQRTAPTNFGRLCFLAFSLCFDLRSSVIGNALGFEPREYRFDPCLRSKYFPCGEWEKCLSLDDANLLKRPPPWAEIRADVAQQVRATVS